MLSLARAPCSVVPNPPVSVEALDRSSSSSGVTPGDEHLDSGIGRDPGGGGGHRERERTAHPAAGRRPDLEQVRYRPPSRRPGRGRRRTRAAGSVRRVGATATGDRTIAASAAAGRRAPSGRRAKGHFMRRWTSKRPCYSSVRTRVNPRRRSRLEQTDEPLRRPVAIQIRRLRPGSLVALQVPGPGGRAAAASSGSLLHELVVLTTSWVPGALGLVLRRLAYPVPARRGAAATSPSATASCSATRARSASGDDVVVDDLVVLDAKGTANRGHPRRQRRLPRPRHDPLVQGRRHRARRPREHRLPLRDLLRLAR